MLVAQREMMIDVGCVSVHFTDRQTETTNKKSGRPACRNRFTDNKQNGGDLLKLQVVFNLVHLQLKSTDRPGQ